MKMNKVTKFGRRSHKTRVRVKKSGLLRLSVFRSNKHIAAQIIDDVKGVTVVSASDAEVTAKTPLEKAQAVGKLIAEKAAKAKITRVVFDRSGYAYHGRVKALCEAARENKLTI